MMISVNLMALGRAGKGWRLQRLFEHRQMLEYCRAAADA